MKNEYVCQEVHLVVWGYEVKWKMNMWAKRCIELCEATIRWKWICESIRAFDCVRPHKDGDMNEMSNNVEKQCKIVQLSQNLRCIINDVYMWCVVCWIIQRKRQFRIKPTYRIYVNWNWQLPTINKSENIYYCKNKIIA